MSSVCLSVCDVSGLWSHRLEFFDNNFTVSYRGAFALCRPKHHGLHQGEQPEIWAQSDPPPVNLSVGDIRSQIAAEWLQIAQRSQWRAYRKLSLTPYDLPFPPNGGSICPQHTRMAISLQRVIRSTSCLVLRFFSGTADRTALFTIRTNPRWRPPPCWKNVKWRYLRNLSSDPLHVLF